MRFAFRLATLAFWALAACSPLTTPEPTQVAERTPTGSPTTTSTPMPTVTPEALPSAVPSPAPLPPATARPTPEPNHRPTNQPTAKPTIAPTTVPPTRTATRLPATVRVYTSTLTLNVYPFERHLKWATDPVTGVGFATLDRPAYEAARPLPQPQAYEVVYLENEQLRLSFLPRWGGRLYQAVYLPTGQELFYNNHVVKPSRFGPFEPEKNWWLAMGGMEWAVPVQEHGHEWGVPWTYRTQSDGSSASITLWDSTAPNRIQTQITVSLRRGEPAWRITAQIANPTARTIPVQFWLNAMLTTTSPSLEFKLPTTKVRVHSTGDKRLPGEKQVMNWPLYNGVDYSRYANWQNWLGVFAEEVGAGWVTVTNKQANISLTRTYPPAVAVGVKLFAFGSEFPDRSYTDDGSEYFELWGGPNRSFWSEDDRRMAAGQKISWTEQWQVSKD